MLKIVSTVAIALALGLSSFPAEAAKTCKTGKLCGNSCIAADKECHAAAAPAKTCKTGKLCGNTCIAATKTCTK